MTKKSRLIILAGSALLFLIITPYIILYSLGYKVNFKTFNVVTTGGIYVRALPSDTDVFIDGKLTDTKGIFTQTVFVQNLLPELHTILIKKDGYFEYQKTLPVKEKSVTKLEHVQLFKKNIDFELLTDATKSPFTEPTPKDLYVVKNNNLYLAVLPTIPQTQATLIIKNIIAYKVSDNTIIWLGLDGFLYRSDLDGKNTEKLTQINIQINKKNTYEIFSLNKNIFLKENTTLSQLNSTAKFFETFFDPVNNVKLSPDGKKIIYYNDYQVFLSYLDITAIDPPLPNNEALLNNFPEKISDVFWLNDDYIVVGLPNKIVITEIDVRGNINSIEIPQPLSLISYNQQEKRLYILNQGTTLVSEKLVP